MRAIQTTRSFWPTFLLFLTVLHLVRSQDTVTVTTIDDSNPAVEYSGGWARIAGGDTNYNGSTMLTRLAGSTATYKFNGIQVSVFGTQGTPGGNTTISTYSIDYTSPSQYKVPSNLNEIQLGIKFYSSPPLPEGEHTLKITNLNDQGWYWLDYIQVTSPLDAPPTSTSSDKTSDPTPTSTPTRTPTQTPTATPTPTLTAGNTQQSKTGISKGVIAGIALGASALVVLLLLAALLWGRRHLFSTEGGSTADLRQSLEEPTMHGDAFLEPYQVEQFASSLSNMPTSRNGLNEKRTHDSVAPIRSAENNINFTQSLVNDDASGSAITQYTSERREDTSEIPRSEPSTSRPMSLSKLRPPYRGAASSRDTGNPPSAPVLQTPPSVTTPPSPPQISSSNRRSTDGGVRIAGGPPPRTRREELGEINAPTLPPAYGTYGDT